MATKCSMPEYVARCVEEISLEGRCGLPVQQLFDLTDTEHDVAYRRYAWRVLSGMKQLRFHVMKPLEDPKSAAKKSKQVDKKPIIEADNGATLRRKRKWSTTLLNNTSSESPQVTRDETAEDGGRLYKRQKHQPLQPVIPSMRRIAAKKQRRRLSDAEESRGDSAGGNSRVRRRRRQNSNDDEVIVVGHAAQSEVVVKDDPTERETQSFNSSGRCRGMSVSLEELDSDSATGRPVIERGIMEQMFVAIQDRRQGLITNYNISVEQVVLGKSTMYRMFVPGAGKEMDKDNYDSSGNIENLAGPTAIHDDTSSTGSGEGINY
ncbi:hypothetical protein PHYBOEH_002881 [Phytophthora boehmeriae]|uniref:Uncharacterized protein n=1 Tax=Phytophthora boehmeriae TaxID=109152 RepID=A0A8T1WW19_9STRA|nr:hypothetical protein PHYBOEH_002881 [Phytophthora boehmeriae]